jgi:glycerol transport system substrate-binding protein
MIVKMKKSMLLGVALTVMFALAAGPAMADMAAAKKWVDEEFQPSTLSKKEQLKEMEWFIKAATPFKGMNIKVVSETIPTHEYEAKTLAKAFEEITGIKVLLT